MAKEESGGESGTGSYGERGKKRNAGQSRQSTKQVLGLQTVTKRKLQIRIKNQFKEKSMQTLIISHQKGIEDTPPPATIVPG
jgi:hypothetical protein